MARAKRLCQCGQLVPHGQPCTNCKQQSDQRRGSARARGYDREHEQRFREGVLARNPVCVEPGCIAPSTVADHHPLDRRDLEARGLDPNDPKHGRGLCKLHHDQHTAQAQPGGWNAR